jgi:hypothetical protein
MTGKWDIERGWIPAGFLEEQREVQDIQRRCLGYHAPETKKICASCVIELMDRISSIEKRRAVLWLSEHGQPALASDLEAALFPGGSR